jgi:hypothetical protein
MAKDREEEGGERRGGGRPGKQKAHRRGTPEADAIENRAETPTAAAGENYNYSDPGRFGERGYTYQVGDEMTAPGPEPPRDDPRWNDWKKHAAAWRNFIGGRQQYVNQMIGVGYDPEDLGIFNRKEEGQAGYRRLTQPGVIDQLRNQAATWMRNSDAEIDPVTGLYTAGNNYYDSRGMRVNQSGQRAGGFYGMENTAGQFGRGAIPRTLGNTQGPVTRPGNPGGLRPTSTPQPTRPLPTAPPPTQNYGGFQRAMTGQSLDPRNRNQRPRPIYGI